jgi:DNA-binding NtrC family response regulator
LLQTQRILLLGVEDATAASLLQAISPLKRRVQIVRERSIDKCLAAIERLRPHILCVPPDEAFLASLRQAFASRGLQLPFVVVSGCGGPREWRTALEGGAADYFAAPFEMSRVDQILAGAASNPMGSFLALKAS